MEKIHGKLLFSRAIIYMSSFKNGISEGEIEDILSLDDDVLYDIFEFHAPPIRRLPIALWSRIKNDLKEYMVEKEINDTRVIYWYHRRFIEVANSFYISKLNSAERETIFGNVFDFFNETWKHKPKPYKYNEYIGKKLKLNEDKAKETRDTTSQPTKYIDPNGNIVYNKRKILELPSFIFQLSASISIKLICEHVLFNYDFLQGVLYSCSFNEFAEIFERSGQSSSYNIPEEIKEFQKEIKLFSLINLQCGLSMVDNPSSALSQTVARVLNFYGQLSNFTKLINEYDRDSIKNCSLIVPYQFLDTPGSDLIFQFEKNNAPIRAAAMGGENDGIVITLSNKIYAFEMSTIRDMGEFSVIETEKPFTSILPYFKDLMELKEDILLKDIKGGFIVYNETDLASYACNSNLYFHKKFDDRFILDVYMVSSSHVAVAYKNKNILEIYESASSKIAHTKIFDHNINLFGCNTHKKYIMGMNDLDEKFILACVLLETMELHVFRVKFDKETKDFALKEFVVFPAPGLDILDLSFIKESIYDYGKSILMSANDGSFIITNFGDLENSEDKSDLKLIHFKPRFRKYKKQCFKLVDAMENTVLLQDLSGNLYISGDDLKCVVKINGKFDNGRIFKNSLKIEGVDGDGKMIIAFTKGLIEYISIFPDRKGENVIRLNSINAHYEEISYSFIKGN
jgi:hypothetical protein